MLHLSGYGTYKLFLALRAHFKSSTYDYVTYKGIINAPKETYESRRDKHFFESMGKKYLAPELRDYFVANFIEGRYYIVDMMGETGQANHIKHKKYKESMEYNFQEDLDKIYKDGISNTLKWNKGEYPHLILLYMGDTIAIETLVILDSLLPVYRNRFDKYLGSDILWVDIRKLIDKTKPFVNFNRERFGTILKGVLRDG